MFSLIHSKQYWRLALAHNIRESTIKSLMYSDLFSPVLFFLEAIIILYLSNKGRSQLTILLVVFGVDFKILLIDEP